MKRKIKRLVIDNFQSHKHSEIEFDDFTVIIGPTDSGKSAIIRALRWCLYNDVEGTGFIREGAKAATVRVEFADGKVITRHRSATENSYQLQSPGLPEVKLANFGTGTVKEVMVFHGMYEANLFGDLTNLNVASQLEPPFFLAESPARKATMIGQIANTDLIDLAIDKAAQDIRAARINERILRKGIKDTEELVGLYVDLPQMRQDLAAVETLFAELSQQDQLASQLGDQVVYLSQWQFRQRDLRLIVSQAAAVEACLDDLNGLILSLSQQGQLQGKINSLKSFKNQHDSLAARLARVSLTEVEEVLRAIEELQAAAEHLTKLRSALASLQEAQIKQRQLAAILGLELDVREAAVTLDMCLSSLQGLDRLLRAKADLQTQADRHVRGQQMIRSFEADYQKSTQKYRDLLAQNPQCPVCQSAITPEKLAQISF